MFDQNFADEIDAWIPEVIAASLARDIEKNMKTMIAAISADPRPMTHDDFALQARILQRTRKRLHALEARLVQIDMLGGHPDPGD